jgi:Arc/MetJ-type ribon-helix-helix transcriptional regulator
MGRPPLSRKSTTKLTGVRLTEDLRDQIIASVGKNQMASFIREAISHELERRNEHASLSSPLIEQAEAISKTSGVPIALIRSAIDDEMQRRDLVSSVSHQALMEMDDALAEVQQTIIDASQRLNGLRTTLNHEIKRRRMNR